MATIGLRDVHYALLIDDPIVGMATYQPTVKVIGAISANINPNSSMATLFYDDGPGDTAATMGEIGLELNLAEIPLKVLAVWLGHEYSGGILKKRGGDVPPWLAIGFRTLKSNGAYRYMWLNKGKFSIPEEAYETKGDSINFQTPTISGSFVKRDCDDEWQRVTDEDSTEFNPSFIATWFTSPNTIAGAWATGTYGTVTVTVSGPTTFNGASVIISGSSTVTAGAETAVWAGNVLTITLANGTMYSRAALQAIIAGASGTSPVGTLTITTNADISALTGTTVTLAMHT
jgi:phi13 family phage major tail protein